MEALRQVLQLTLDYIRDLVEIVAERLSMCSLLLITHIVQKLISFKILFSEINDFFHKIAQLLFSSFS